MGMPEFNDREFGNVIPLPNAEAMEKFKELNEHAKKLHFGEIDELERHKQVMEAINDVDRRLRMICDHFKIYPMVGGSKLTKPDHPTAR